MFLGDHPLAWGRILAMAVGVGVTMVGQGLLKASSPASGAMVVVLATGWRRRIGRAPAGWLPPSC